MWLKGFTRTGLRQLMRFVGIEDMTATSAAELNVYVDLLSVTTVRGRLSRSKRNFETTPEKQALYNSTPTDVPYPVQAVWGERDPMLKVDIYGEAAAEAAGLKTIHRRPAKHFLQEDQAEAIAELVSAFVSSQNGR
jgi:pimeloyl-ACP methyl ester carboxylesterase